MTDSDLQGTRPDFVPAPGATLEELLDERGMTQAQLALQMSRPRKTINEIIQGKAAIAPETALQLERVLGLPAEFWMRREAEYRAFRARDEESRRLARSVSWLRKIPVRGMIRRGWIASSGDRVEQLRRCLDFFRVARPEQLDELALVSGVEFRRTMRFKSDPFALAAWLRRGELLAESRSASLPPYDADAFRSVVEHVGTLTFTPLSRAFETLHQQCANAGVALLVVPELPKTCVSGASRWISERPMIQLSMRYKTEDQVWFTFCHEAAHLLLHARGSVYVDEERGATTADAAKESEANHFAADALLPPARLAAFLRSQRAISKESIRAFASTLGVAPGIVVGRLQHDGELPHNHCNELKALIPEHLVEELASR